jgi:hypothetical protein
MESVSSSRALGFTRKNEREKKWISKKLGYQKRGSYLKRPLRK